MLQRPAIPTTRTRFERVRTALLAARLTRPQPARDDKVVTAWNGLAITALAEASVALAAPELADAAADCATALLRLHLVDGRLRRASLGGRVGDSAAILEDHAMLATGLLALYQLTADDAWLTAATGLLDIAVAHFADRDRPGRWFDTADDAEQLVLRPADPYRRRDPVGRVVDRRGAADRGASDRRQRADRYLQRPPTRCRRTPCCWPARRARPGTGWPSPKPLCAGRCRSPSPAPARARRCWPPPAGSRPAGRSSLAARWIRRSCWPDRDRVGGADAAYVCRGRVCDLPVTSAEALAAALAR